MMTTKTARHIVTEKTVSESSDEVYNGAFVSKIASSFNEYDWVAAAKNAASGAAGMLDCAADITAFKDDFLDQGDELVSPTALRTGSIRRGRSSTHQMPRNEGNESHVISDLGHARIERVESTRHPIRENNTPKNDNNYAESTSALNYLNHPTIETGPMDGMSTLTPVSARPLPLTMEKSSGMNMWDGNYATNPYPDQSNIPDQSNDQNFLKSQDQKSDNPPVDKRKRRYLIGAIVVLAVILLAVGIAVPFVLKRTAPASAEQNGMQSIAEEEGRGDNIPVSPTSFPYQGTEQDSDSPNYDKEQSTVGMVPPSPSLSSPSDGQSPVIYTQQPNAPVTTAAPPQSLILTSASPTISRDADVPSSTVIWGGSFSQGTGETPMPGPVIPETNQELITNPSPQSITSNPTSSAETTRPSVRPIIVMPTPLPTKIESTESSINEQHDSLQVTKTPITNQIASPPPTRRPTRIPINPTIDRPTTDKPTSLAPTPSPTSLAPTESTSKPTTERPTPSSQANIAPVTDSRLKIELQTDEYGHETSWTFYSIDSETDEPISLVAAVEENTYGPFDTDSIYLTLSPGKYRFTLKDAFGDGFCCSNGSNGSYAIFLNGVELIRGDHYLFQKRHDILVGHDPKSTMSSRDLEWLEAHNHRRKTWHERHGKTYVPLIWSAELAARASSWAHELLNDCDISGISHESDVPEGENLAKNKGSSDLGMGKFYPPENILRRWVDLEETWGYPRNAHLTQALWRASRYLGCGDAVKNFDDGSICRIQVCRYIKAGNCAMGSFNANEGDKWLVPMLMEHSGCGPVCPPEGCY